MATERTQCSIEGVYLLASAPVEWPLRAGVQPVEQQFDIRAEDADRFKAMAGRAVTLKIVSNENTLEAKNLWVMEVRPGPNPHINRVRLADRRWFLQRSIVDREYNVRRPVGFKRVGANAQDILNPVTPDLWYAKWSLRNEDGNPPEAKWKFTEMLKDVFEAAQEAERKHAGSSAEVIVKPEVKAMDQSLSVEDLRLHDSGDAAVHRAIAFAPEAAFYVDLDGNYIVFSRVSGLEASLVSLLKPPYVIGGATAIVDNAAVRPEDVEVYFEPLVEMRIDCLEITTGSTTTAMGKDRRMENVFEVPDYSLTAADGQTIVQGSYVPVDTILALWPTPADIPLFGGSQLTHEIIQKAMAPFLDLFAALLITGERDPDADWASRISVIDRDYRQLYRINSQITDRCRSIKARRVGLIDPETGTSGPAEAYSDYFLVGTQRSFHKNLNAGHSLEYGVNVNGYPTGAVVRGVASLTSDSRPAPATVSVVNEEQGIIRVDYRADKLRLYTVVLPSHLTRADGVSKYPCGNPVDKDRPIAFDSVIDANQVPRLSASHKICVILTVVPAAPNDERKLFKITVKPTDVEGMLPANARNGLHNCKGPTWRVRVGGGLPGAQAMIRWVDSRADDIDKMLGILDGKPDLQGLVMNAEDQSKLGTQAASLNEIARATAARIYARFADHYEGEVTSALSPTARLDGWVDEIIHRVETNGIAATTARFPDKGVEIDFWSLLDSSTRALLRQEPQR